MLSEDPEQDAKIILCDKPKINEDDGNIDPKLLDKLLGNISILSSVYYKPPENFVKKIRNRINERLDLENEDGQMFDVKDDEYVDSTGFAKSQ